MAQFEFATANRIIFGADSINQVPQIATSFGQRILLVIGGSSTSAAANRLEQQLHAHELRTTRFTVRSEPDIQTIEAGIEAARAADCDQVIALGGGSVIDAGKAISGLMANEGSLLDYLEIVGRGQPIQNPAAPMIAIPTTAGTGAEVTRNAVIGVPEKHIKVSMRSPYLLPCVAVVDPVLTYTLPPDITAHSGLDAITQLIEAYTSSRHNPLTDGIARAGLERGINALFIAYGGKGMGTAEELAQARADMAFASLCSGLALANSGLGAVHGFAAALGGHYPIPHGLCCAVMLPHVLEANIDALQMRQPRHFALERYEFIAHTFEETLRMEQLPELLEAHYEQMDIPKLSALGVTDDAVPELVRQAAQSNSMKGNPIALTTEELTRVLRAAL